MSKSYKAIAMGAVLLTLSGCGTTGWKSAAGGLGGGLTGAAACSNIGGGTGKVVAIVACTIGGVFAGAAVGQHLDDEDARQIRLAQAEALQAPLHEPVRWRNPKTRTRGVVVPTRDFVSDEGDYCREYTTQIQVAGKKKQQGYGKACRQQDGAWRIVS